MKGDIEELFLVVFIFRIFFFHPWCWVLTFFSFFFPFVWCAGYCFNCKLMIKCGVCCFFQGETCVVFSLFDNFSIDSYSVSEFCDIVMDHIR